MWRRVHTRWLKRIVQRVSPCLIMNPEREIWRIGGAANGGVAPPVQHSLNASENRKIRKNALFSCFEY